MSQNIATFTSPKFLQDITDMGTAIIDQAQESGEINNSSDPALLTTVMQTQLVGVVSSWCTSNGEFDLKNAVKLTMEVCFDVKPELRKAPIDIFKKI